MKMDSETKNAVKGFVKDYCELVADGSLYVKDAPPLTSLHDFLTGGYDKCSRLFSAFAAIASFFLTSDDVAPLYRGCSKQDVLRIELLARRTMFDSIYVKEFRSMY